MPDPTPSSALAEQLSRSLGRVQRRVPLLPLIALSALFLVAYSTIPGITGRTSAYAILILASFLGLAALGQTLVVLLGGLDLAVPGFILLGAFGVAQLTGGQGWPLWLALVAISVAAAVGGCVTGLVSYVWRVQPLIVSLGVGTMITGIMLVWIGGQQPPPVPVGLSKFSAPIGTTFGLAVPPILVMWAILIVVVALVLRCTVTGRRLYLAGANPVAADLVAIPTARIWIGAYALSAFSAALVGVFLAGFGGTADVTLGDPYLLQSLTAVIVGGTSFGARGSYTRTVVGSLILVVLSTILVGHGYSFADQQIVYGVLILVAVFMYGRDRRLSDRI